MKGHERFEWARITIDPKPGDRILEIGCGAGLLVEQMANHLQTGSVTGIDRSAAMLKNAEKRNSTLIAAGKVKLMPIDFLDSQFQNHEFDKIAAFNVNFFWKESKVPLAMLRRILKPEGWLYVFYQAPYEIDIRHADPIKKELVSNSFRVVDTILKQMAPTSAFCIIAQPS